MLAPSERDLVILAPNSSLTANTADVELEQLPPERLLLRLAGAALPAAAAAATTEDEEEDLLLEAASLSVA